MFRLVLTLVYLIAAVCGPRPCCCAAPVPPPEPVQPTKAPPKCPLCAAAEAEKTPSPKPEKKPDCPCQKSRPAPTPQTVPPTTGDDARLLTTDTFAEPAVGCTLFAADPGRPTPVVGPPPDPSHHLLQLCHRLRC